MAHGHHHGHAHHDHAEDRRRSRRGLSVALALTFAVFLAEIAGGIAAGSLALLADAGHMLTDVAARSARLPAAMPPATSATKTANVSPRATESPRRLRRRSSA